MIRSETNRFRSRISVDAAREHVLATTGWGTLMRQAANRDLQSR